MRKNIIYLIISLLVFGIFFTGCQKYKIESDEKAVNKAMARNSKVLAKKYCMNPVGVTVAMPDGDIQFLELEFQIQGPLSRSEIREILINAAHDFLEDINSDTELCSYLKNHSLTIKDIGIGLFLIDSSGRGLRDPYIGIAEISKGVLWYNILIEIYDNVIKKEIPQFKSEYKESYEDALAIINNNKC